MDTDATDIRLAVLTAAFEALARVLAPAQGNVAADLLRASVGRVVAELGALDDEADTVAAGQVHRLLEALAPSR